MKVLVAFASKHGSTEGIAEFIGEKLREKGIEVEVIPTDKVRGIGSYDAFVIGSALYLGRWIKEAKQFASKNSAVLSMRPVWLFSSGPTGTNLKDAKGNDLLDPKVSGPKELDELKEDLRFRDHRIFFGAFDPKDLDFFSRQFFKSAAIREATPIGDFRDWKEIEAWSAGIAQSLQEISSTTTS
ncbi:MAG: flavodoxin domain-containing protein [Nitrososphaerota archaeon]|nr:flavodoxin domain-containing protein [Nitrososphaerota archaeon]